MGVRSDVAAVPPEGVEIRLKTGSTLAGRLLGLKTPDCKLSLYAEHGLAPPFVLAGHSDAPGHYTLPELSAGDWEIVATCGEQSALRSVQIRSGEAAPTLDLDSVPVRSSSTGECWESPERGTR